MTQEQGTSNDNFKISFPEFCWRIIAVYMIAYLISGMIAQIYYKPVWDAGVLSTIMRPMNSPWVALGPALQSINAFALAMILFPLRSILIGQKKGWVTLFLLMAGFSIFVPQAPAPSSFEGLIYTKLSIFEHLIGLPETFLFSFLFSFGIYQWYQKPNKIWDIVSIAVIVFILAMSTLGYLAAIGLISQS